MEKELAAIAADFMALPSEGRRAVAHVVKRLADRARQGPMTSEESASLLVEAARETGNARLVDAAERTAGRAV